MNWFELLKQRAKTTATKQRLRDTCLVHMHTPRAAGTTLRQALIPKLLEHFSPSQIFLVDMESEYGCPSGSLTDLARLSEGHRSRIRFVSGHVPLSITELFPNPFTFTVLREPVDRAVSAYWYCYHHTENAAHQKTTELSPPEFIAQGWGEARNGQARYLSGHFFTDKLPSDQELLDAAIGALEQLAYVGFFDDLATTLNALCAIAGVSSPTYLPRTNAADRMQITEADLSIIEACNQVDAVLYAYAIERWRNRSIALTRSATVPSSPPSSA